MSSPAALPCSPVGCHLHTEINKSSGLVVTGGPEAATCSEGRFRGDGRSGGAAAPSLIGLICVSSLGRGRRVPLSHRDRA